MFTDDELFEILRILAVVLHLGNLQYTGKISKRFSHSKKTMTYFFSRTIIERY